MQSVMASKRSISLHLYRCWRAEMTPSRNRAASAAGVWKARMTSIFLHGNMMEEIEMKAKRRGANHGADVSCWKEEEK